MLMTSFFRLIFKYVLNIEILANIRVPTILKFFTLSIANHSEILWDLVLFKLYYIPVLLVFFKISKKAI